MSDTELRIGAQTRAASQVHQAVGPIQDVLQELDDAIAAAGGGFKGAAAAGLGEALQAWYAAAATLAPTLIEFASKLVETDVTAGRNEEAVQNKFARLLGQLP